MDEIWKDIPGFEGWYQVSNLGRVKRVKKVHWNHGNREFTLVYEFRKSVKYQQKCFSNISK